MQQIVTANTPEIKIDASFYCWYICCYKNSWLLTLWLQSNTIMSAVKIIIPGWVRAVNQAVTNSHQSGHWCCGTHQCRAVYIHVKASLEANMFFLSFYPSVTHTDTHSNTCPHVDKNSITARKCAGPFLVAKKMFSLVPLPFIDSWWMVSWDQIHQSHHGQSHMDVWAKAPGASLFSLQQYLQETLNIGGGKEGKVEW